MSLRHYTANLESAKSIIASKELWLRRTGEAPKDEKEVNHYFKVFNDFHTIAALKEYKKGREMNFSSGEVTKLLGTYNELMYRKKSLRIGDVLEKILKEQTHIICFTEEENESVFHNKTYGEICFQFNDNPLKQINGFNIVKQKVTYLNTEKFADSHADLESLYEDLINKYLNGFDLDMELHGLHMQVDKFYNEKIIKEGEIDKFLKSYIRFEDVDKQRRHLHALLLTENNEELNGTAQYLTKAVNELREREMLKLFSDKNAQALKNMGTFKHPENINMHKQNIAACFIKGRDFKNDKETRIIALPNKNYTYKESYLKVPYNTNVLEKIIISQDIEFSKRQQYVSDLKSALSEAGINNVQII